MEDDFRNDLLRLENQLCFKLYQTSRNMTRRYQPLLDEFDLTYPQYIVLLVLFQQKSIEFRELSEIVDLRKATLTPIINRLELRELISKEILEEDKRRFNVVLTSKGEELKKSIIKVPISLYDELRIEEKNYRVMMSELSELLEKLNYKE